VGCSNGLIGLQYWALGNIAQTLLFCVGYQIFNIRGFINSKEIEMNRPVDLNTTFVYVVDHSLGMSKGKIAAQVSHVAMQLADKNKCLGTALVLKADHERFMQLYELVDGAEAIEDAGLTQVLPGTLTCFGFVGTEKTKELTKDLKLV
jgi:peptidyl-tRNA hydrolase